MFVFFWKNLCILLFYKIPLPHKTHIPTEMLYFCQLSVKNMRKSLPDAFIYVKRVKFQVEFPGNQIQFPGSQNPLLSCAK